MINPEAPEDVTTFGCGLFQEFLRLPDFNAILFVDPLGMETINNEGRWRCIPRISWDGISNTKLKATRSKVAYDPFADRWVPFTVDLRTGECEGSVVPKGVE